jgi:hypothetical protein
MCASLNLPAVYHEVEWSVIQPELDQGLDLWLNSGVCQAGETISHQRPLPFGFGHRWLMTDKRILFGNLSGTWRDAGY